MNIQVGGDSVGNVYVSCEDDTYIYVFEGDVGAKSFRNQNITFSPVATFSGVDISDKYTSHSLFVPQNTSKTFGVVYKNSTSLMIQKASVSSGTCTYKNVTAINIPEVAGFNSPSLYMSGDNAYVSYGYSLGGENYVGVNNFPIPTSTPGTYEDWSTQYSNPNMGGVIGKNATISSGTKLNMGYINKSGYYKTGSYQSGSSWYDYSGGGLPVADVGGKSTTNGTSPFSLLFTSGYYSGLNLFYYETSGSSAGYFLPVGTPAVAASPDAYGTPIVANGKKTVAYTQGSALYVVQNSSTGGPWTQKGTFAVNHSDRFGVGSTVNGAPLISYVTKQYGTSGYWGIRTQAYTSTTPKIIAQREFIRATFLCCYAGVTLPLPRL